MRGRFFQFPLCALSFPASERERLNHIIAFCCLETGELQCQKFSQVDKDLGHKQQPSELCCTREIDVYLQAVAGAQQLKVAIVDIYGLVAEHARLARFVGEFERKYGADAKVRLATNLVFEARDGKGLSYRELAVLAAVYSKIGAAKGPVRILREEIWCRALGFKSKRVFFLEMRNREAWITERQVRSIIERLHDRKFFARVTYGRRQSYYSHRLNLDQLIEAVVFQKLKRAQARQARIRADADLTARIQAERNKLASPNAIAAATHAPL
jgi:hypothetical protein